MLDILLCEVNIIQSCACCGARMKGTESIQLPPWIFGPGRYLTYGRCPECRAVTISNDSGTTRGVIMPSEGKAGWFQVLPLQEAGDE